MKRVLGVGLSRIDISRPVKTIAVSAGVLFIVFTEVAVGDNGYKLIGSDWKYNANPMGKDFVVCLTNAPPDADQAIKAAATTWNYPKFKFTFKANACSSKDQFPAKNDVNQIDFGSLSQRILVADGCAGCTGSDKALDQRRQDCRVRHQIQQRAELAYRRGGSPSR